MRWLGLLASLLLANLVVAMEVPPAYPELDKTEISRSLVVATMKPGAYLPAFPECANPDVVCMDPPPFWLDAHVLSVIHGDIKAVDIAIASTSHYGMPEEDDPTIAYLMPVVTDARQFILPRYARARLYEGKGGEYYLPVLPNPIHWLPCSVAEIGREVTGLHRVKHAVIPKDWMQVRGVHEHPEFFKLTWRGAQPRYWTAMSSLREHLSQKSKEAPLTCEDPTGSTED